MSNKYQVLISSSAKNTIRESAELAKELNLGIEISRLPFYQKTDTKVEDVCEKLKTDLKDFNGRVTLHAMFSDVNVASQDPILSEIAKQRYRESFEVGRAIKADTILFHTGNKGTKHYGSQEQFKTRYINFWRGFIKNFEEDGITAVLENVFEETPKYCMEILKGVDSPNLKLALDTGHVNIYAPKTEVCEWIETYGKNLLHMHIHNNFKENDDHSNLKNGTLDFNKILTHIKRTNINPSFVFEMFKEEDIRISLEIFNEIMN